jgi:hypothetical protein
MQITMKQMVKELSTVMRPGSQASKVAQSKLQRLRKMVQSEKDL